MCFASLGSAVSSFCVLFTAVFAFDPNAIQYNEVNIPKEMTILKDMERRGIYNSLDMYLSYFRKAPLTPVSDGEWQSKVLHTYHSECPQRPRDPLPAGRRRLIVIESFDNYLRRAVAVQVAQELNAAKYTTPAPCLHAAMPSRWVSLRTPFYALGIYATAHLVQPVLHNRTVILHRYWYDVSIFPLMESIRQNRYCPREGSILYEWPQDLLKPDIVFLLLHTNGTYKGSRQHMSLRLLTTSMMEIILEIFSRIKDVKVVQIDASLRMKFIIEQILSTVNNLFPEWRARKGRPKEANSYYSSSKPITWS